MMDIVAPLQCLRPHVTVTTHRRLSRITLALLVMTGRITMRGLSRWAGKGGSYRTVQRWFSTVLPWAMLFWVFFRHHLHCLSGEVVQKFLKERIGICQGQLHGRFSCRQQGKFFTSCSINTFAKICDLVGLLS